MRFTDIFNFCDILASWLARNKFLIPIHIWILGRNIPKGTILKICFNDRVTHWMCFESAHIYYVVILILFVKLLLTFLAFTYFGQHSFLINMHLSFHWNTCMSELPCPSYHNSNSILSSWLAVFAFPFFGPT